MTWWLADVDCFDSNEEVRTFAASVITWVTSELFLLTDWSPALVNIEVLGGLSKSEWRLSFIISAQIRYCICVYTNMV